MPKQTQYQHKLEYNNTYNRNNYRSFSVRFNNASEVDIINWLENQDSIKGYLSSLILADMKKKEKAAKRSAKKNG